MWEHFDRGLEISFGSERLEVVFEFLVTGKVGHGLVD
jgi:hypothetical protein